MKEKMLELKKESKSRKRGKVHLQSRDDAKDVWIGRKSKKQGRIYI